MHLRNSDEFRLVYSTGRRFEGRFMTVFVRPNSLDQHRLGITASRKLSQRAVDRNRLKRVLRETFRLSSNELGGLENRYDWVLNPRRALLDADFVVSLKDFHELIALVNRNEKDSYSREGLRKL